MIGLFDRDVFYKLCCCNPFDETVHALGITEPYRLGATSSEGSNRKAVTRLLSGMDPEEAIERVQSLVLAVPVLSDDLVEDVTATEDYQALGDVDDIDAGEQLLAAILLHRPDGRLLISGDKRFAQAVRSKLPGQWNAIRGSVISFEACLVAVEAIYGFEYLLERVSLPRSCDGSLRLALGANPSREDFLAALASFDPCRPELDHAPAG